MATVPIGACRPGHTRTLPRLFQIMHTHITRTGCEDTYIAYACLPTHKRTCTYSVQRSNKKRFPQLCIKCSVAKSGPRYPHSSAGAYDCTYNVPHGWYLPTCLQYDTQPPTFCMHCVYQWPPFTPTDLAFFQATNSPESQECYYKMTYFPPTLLPISLTNSLDGMPCIPTVHLPLTPVEFLLTCTLLA